MLSMKTIHINITINPNDINRVGFGFFKKYIAYLFEYEIEK